jgi:hypothetical protein
MSEEEKKHPASDRRPYEYNYACEECGRSFADMETLTKHRQQAHSKSIGTALT